MFHPTALTEEKLLAGNRLPPNLLMGMEQHSVISTQKSAQQRPTPASHWLMFFQRLGIEHGGASLVPVSVGDVKLNGILKRCLEK